VSSGLLLGIDEGTTAVKAALFDCELRTLAEARRPVPVSHPRAGWVEQDPELIVQAVVDAVAEVLEHTEGREVLAAGLDHQGESVLAWEAGSTRALTQVLVWQDKRQQALLSEIDARAERAGVSVSERSGLPLDPYFSAGKLAWLLANDDSVRRAREAGRLRLGTVDAFLAERLGGRFATDLSTASRTQLLARGGRDWDEQLLDAFGVHREWLPALGPSFGSLGELKATYGTGVFVLGRTREPVRAHGLLPTIAWAAPKESRGSSDIGEVAHALDGGVFSAGSLLDWLAGGLGLAPDAAALAAAAASVSDSAGVMVLPALAGLGAPWWDSAARGVIAGLHPAVRPAHVARAALEAIAWRVADIVETVALLTPVERLHVDGGLTNDATLLQIQADALGLALIVGRADATVLGAAMLAGVGAGVFASVEDAASHLPPGRVIEPRADAAGPGARAAERSRWRAFVRASAQL
jgi:glycerol kinase